MSIPLVEASLTLSSAMTILGEDLAKENPPSVQRTAASATRPSPAYRQYLRKKAPSEAPFWRPLLE